MSLSVFSLFSLFNLLSPKERTSRKVAAGLPYAAGRRRRLDIYAPKDRGRPYPVIVFCYGGSWTDGDRRTYDFVGRALAALGYVVAIPDHRLVPEIEYPEFLEDLDLAVAWVAEHAGRFGGDATRMVLMGQSAGAYNAAMLAFDRRYLAAPGLRARIRAFVGISGPYDFLPFDGPISIRVFGAVRDPKSTQPINHAGASAPPSFLAHGDADTLVYPRNTVALAEVLRSAGVEVVETHYAGLGHPQPLLAIGRVARKRAPILAEIAQFLAVHTATVPGVAPPQRLAQSRGSPV